MTAVGHPSGLAALRAPAVPLVVELGSARGDVELIGAKAAGLERLIAGKLPCPPGFCVTTAALALCLEGASPTGCSAASPRVTTCDGPVWPSFSGGRFPFALARRLTSSTRALCALSPGARLLAVRASAIDEDGAMHSFAGVHVSALGVPADAVPAAVERCWSSLWASNALAYRSRHGLSPPSASMAVLVQTLVPARASAVVFTANPLSGAEDEVLIHATNGLGTALVENRISPDIAVLDRRDLTLRELEIGEKHVRIDARPAGGTVVSRTREGDLPALSETELRRLARLAIEAERLMGCPVDVEAALSDRWYLTQARPITGLAQGGVG